MSIIKLRRFGFGRVGRLGRTAALTTLVVGGVGATTIGAAAPAFAASGSSLYVSPTGHNGAGDHSCRTAGYSTISTAVAAARSGATVHVCAGSYAEAVVIDGKVVHLTGDGADSATIAPPATSDTAGLTIEGDGASGSSVTGLTITGARQEGLLVQHTSHITVAHNRVTGNNLACQPQVNPSLDCGEGLHLRAVSHSRVIDNEVSHNTGGIHITDGVPAGSIGETAFGYTSPSGPSFDNLIEGNSVVANLWDCGISLPSHNSTALGNPTAGGVYDNTITKNLVLDNGTSGSGGAGILMATGFPGTAAYDNTVTHNVVSGNGHSGVAIHSHAPAQDVHGNVIEFNEIGRNNAIGDFSAGVTQTAGVIVFSAVVPVTDTVITHNHFVDDHYGIWLSNAPGTDTSHNSYLVVDVPVKS
jgi:nitrous oxidase accessory protein NosD